MVLPMGIAEIFVVRDAMILHVSKERCGDCCGDLHMVIERNITGLIGGSARGHIRKRVLQDAEQLIHFHIRRRAGSEILPQLLLNASVSTLTSLRPGGRRIIHRLRRIEHLQRIVRLLTHAFKYIEYILQGKLPVKGALSLACISPVQPGRQVIRFVDHIGQIISGQMRRR